MHKHEDKAKRLDYLPLGYVASLGAGKISHSSLGVLLQESESKYGTMQIFQ